MEIVPADLVRPALWEMIRKDHPDLGPGDRICQADLNRYRSRYVEELLSQERGGLSELEREVVQVVRDQALLASNTNAEFESGLTLGERLADRVAHFGGSWAFILTFGLILVVWIAANTVLAFGRPFDPYPFILLNLILSCVAALQAPVIMMSQNRQEAKDRLRAENDYQINLKAELEVRLLTERIDHLIKHQWMRLLEIQEIQVELMEELGRRRKQAEESGEPGTR
ncbi:MAG: DUF1003 domain-containing protein [Acidobacteriota bacterium]